MRRVFFIGIILAFLHSPAIAGPNDNVTVLHDTDSTRKFPGQGTVANWHAGQDRCRAGLVALKAKDYDRAVADSEDAIRIYPYEAAFYNQLAVALWQRKKTGDLELGIKYVKKAVDISPETFNYWDNLAKALVGIDKLQEARDALVHGSQCKTTPEQAAEIKVNIGIIDQALAKQQ